MATVGIVTGAGRGMGLACARKLVSMVDQLLLVDLDASSVTGVADQLGGDGAAVVEPVVLDVTDAAGLPGLAGRVAELGRLRAVAHVAGISPTMADWRRIFTVDLIGTAMLTDALYPLAGPGTAMVCFASMAAVLGAGMFSTDIDAILDSPLDPTMLDRLHDTMGEGIEDSGIAYAVAKHGVRRFVQREAPRWGKVGARICSISPGIIDTPQGRQESEANDAMAALLEHTPLQREGHADEVAALAAFLLSDEASFITGTDVLIDGGVCAALATR